MIAMGHCKNCKWWDRTPFPVGGMELQEEAVARGYGRCKRADHPVQESGEPVRGGARAMYDGGYFGELITHGDFGCNLFEGE